MKQSKTSLKNTPDIVATYIVSHNLCIANNEKIQGGWIVIENKLARRINKGKIREDSELQGERARLVEVKRKILTREDVPIVHDVNGVETQLFLLRESERQMTFYGKRQ